ncbi:MAG TPA: decaprenyl-phosphate phosphoribosyltransferase [Solirubrobacteraceae bacterium]|nr:decaprenyl-phosphate phosphoribosyltransferase [Solirubrobacteraceae bacterium]
MPSQARVHPEPAATGIAGARTWALQLRCHQWAKNLLVLAAPAAADALGHSVVAARAALAFVVFCLLSSAVYLLNDIVDLEEDRRHPVKRHRPIAAGVIGIPEALIAAGGCLLVALVTAALVDARLLLIAVAYAGLNLAYTSWARRVPIVDICAIAACFVLRALAGGAATGIGISSWFILVVTLGALLVAAGKRYADVVDSAARRSRAVLRRYDPHTLRRIGAGSAAGAILAYALWAVDGGPTDVPVLRILSLLPLAAAIIRYLRLAGDGRGGAPEKLLVEDRQLQLTCLLWMVLFLAGA